MRVGRNEENDAKFIAHARIDIPYLLAEVSSLESRLHAVTEALRQIEHDGLNQIKTVIRDEVGVAPQAEAPRPSAPAFAQTCSCAHDFDDHVVLHGQCRKCPCMTFRVAESRPSAEEVKQLAIQWVENNIDDCESMTTFKHGTVYMPMLKDGKWVDSSLAEILAVWMQERITRP
jgi:hypothetical protein